MVYFNGCGCVVIAVLCCLLEIVVIFFFIAPFIVSWFVCLFFKSVFYCFVIEFLWTGRPGTKSSKGIRSYFERKKQKKKVHIVVEGVCRSIYYEQNKVPVLHTNIIPH